MKKLLLLTLITFVAGQFASLAQVPPSPVSEQDLGKEVDAYIRKTMEAIPEIPSVALVVVKGDKPIFMQAYGVANKETGAKPNANSSKRANLRHIRSSSLGKCQSFSWGSFSSDNYGEF